MPGPDRGPIAVLAGSGLLPILVADELRRTGREHRVLAFRGFATRATRSRADAVIDLLDVTRALARLDEWKPAAVTLAGAVSRPTPSAVLNTFAFLRNRRELGEILSRGDDQLLRGVVGLLEERGHMVVGAHELAPQILAGPGSYGRHQPGALDLRSIEVGMRLLHDLSVYDIGQAAVVSGERVTAIEGPEGTDRMLARIERLSRGWLGRARSPGGVLVKTAKRDQDLRVDLPAIGPQTFVRAARAGLRGVAVGAGSTLILDRERTIATADRLGLFFIGVETVVSPEGQP